MIIYILNQFGADWLIFVDARVFTRKLWTDGPTSDGQRRTVSDHNSSLSTPWSGELKILHVSYLKTFAGKNSNVSKMTTCHCDRVENTVQRGENAVYQHFLLFPVFKKATFSGSLNKLVLCDKG